MKIQLDTVSKTIRIEETVVIGDLLDTLEELLPNKWKSFKLETVTQINWANPTPAYPNVPSAPIQPYYREQWYDSPWIVTSHDGSLDKNCYDLKNGVFNISI